MEALLRVIRPSHKAMKDNELRRVKSGIRKQKECYFKLIVITILFARVKNLQRTSFAQDKLVMRIREYFVLSECSESKGPGGGTGRLGGFKILCHTACEFESRPGHIIKNIITFYIIMLP